MAYRFAAIAEQLGRVTSVGVIYGSGGALRKSPAWVQILADVLGQPIELTEVAEASGRGAALLGLERLGSLTDLNEVAPRSAGTITPNPRHHERYARARERQQRLRDLLFGEEI